MIVVKTINEVRQFVKEARLKGKTIGFVPTMGFLHEGHLSLMRESNKQTDITVVSIFVNPTQFGPNEDLATYPRDFDRDQMLCESVGVNLIFAPDVEEMYPSGHSTIVDCEGPITKQLCGASRPTHFKGVTSVVAKLFNIVAPDKAFFGQKDAQQVAVIEKMVRELDFDIEIVSCPIVREGDGLAMSSRNTYLDEEARKQALVLSQSLFAAKASIDAGATRVSELITLIRDTIQKAPLAEIDYVQIVDARTLLAIDEINDDTLIALAVKFGKTRLIDNLRIRRR